MRFLVETFSKLECEILNDWLRSERETGMTRRTNDLLSIVSRKLYKAMLIPPSDKKTKSELSHPTATIFFQARLSLGFIKKRAPRDGRTEFASEKSSSIFETKEGAQRLYRRRAPSSKL